MNHVSQNSPNNLPDKIPETVEKDVRKWVESICEFKANLEMEKCELPQKKSTKKVKKLKVKKKLSVHSALGDEKKNQAKAKVNSEQKITKSKPTHKKSITKEKQTKDSHPPHSVTVFENLRHHYKSAKLPPNWVSGQSRGRLVFCRVKVLSHGSQHEMVSDRGVAITNDCMVHVFIDGPEVIVNSWKMQKVETIEDIRRAIKAVDGFKICSGAAPNGVKNPSCSIFLNGETKICQACKSDTSHLKLSGLKMRTNPKLSQKTASLQK